LIAVRDRKMRAAMPKAPKALHLTAAMQVVRAHQRRRHVTVEDARHAIKDAAHSIARGVAGPETQRLAAKLEKLTGISVAELAVHAEDWPEL
jgi:hypothetical protein